MLGNFYLLGSGASALVTWFLANAPEISQVVTETSLLLAGKFVGMVEWAKETGEALRAQKETKPRKTLGKDGGKSKHIVEKDASGDTISVTHQVEKDGEVIHQHQTHIGKESTKRMFPDEWVEYPQIGD